MDGVASMATLKDVAALAGVSMSTAGAAIRGEDIVKPATRDKVLAAAKQLGYSPNLSARFLKKGRTGSIAALIPSITHPYYANLVAAISKAADKRHLRTLIMQTGYDADTETDIVSQINSAVCDGLILNASNVDDKHLKAMLGNHPTVLLNYQVDDPLFDNVLPPLSRGASVSFGYLAGRGYRHACIVGGHPLDKLTDDLGGRSPAIRYTVAAMKDSGLGDEHDFVECNWETTSAIAAAHRLCETDADGTRMVDRYDVFYCMNDLIAYGLIRGFHDEGVRVPQDKAVFGNDGIYAYGEQFTVPTLSTLALDYDDTAEKALDLLVDQIEHPDVQREPRVDQGRCRLIIGESA